MPLVPRFELTQTDSEVIVLVFVTTIRVESIEVLLDDDSILHFHARPYSLTLNFAPHEFDAEAQGIVSAQYDPSIQTIRVPIMKANKGETWPNLDMTARLMRPKEIPKQWLHAVVDSQETDTQTGEGAEGNKKMSSLAEETKDTINPIHSTLSSSHGYGFGNLFQNIFTDYCRSGIAQEMLSLPEPETTEPSERRSQRMVQEQEDFDPDRYDYTIEDDYLYECVMGYVPFWKQMPKERSNQTSSSSRITSANELADSLDAKLTITDDVKASTSSSPFTADEKLQLSTIPYPLIPDHLLRVPPVSLLDDGSSDALWCGLLDLLIPYIYDHLMTMGDPTVESAWTITKLSCSLSWLDPPRTIQELIVGTTRRMLIYPYWRNLDFALTVWDHLLSMLESSSGLHAAIKCLLQMRSILEKSEFYYAGNKLYLDPYLYWVQHQDVSSLMQLLKKIRAMLEKGNLKADVDLDLAIYENLAFGEDEEDGSSVEETASSSEESESENEEEDNSVSDSDDSSNARNGPKAADSKTSSQLQEAAERSESKKVSSTLLELEDDEAPKGSVLHLADQSSTPSTKGKLLIEEIS